MQQRVAIDLGEGAFLVEPNLDVEAFARRRFHGIEAEDARMAGGVAALDAA